MDLTEMNLVDHLSELSKKNPHYSMLFYSFSYPIFSLRTLPIAALQVWLFVKPGLKKEEQKITLAFIPGIFLLFVSGIAFGYFLVFPIVLSFLQTLAGSQFEIFFTVEKYFSFLINLTLPFGFLV